MNVLVAGGVGFIGYYVSLNILRKGFSIVVYDSLERSSYERVAKLRKLGVEIIEANVVNYRSFISALRKFSIDIVVHLAAYVSVSESIRKPFTYFKNNALGTAVVAEACRRADVGRVVYASSAAVYGEPKYLPIDEEHPTESLSPYGLSKLVGELVLRQYARNYGLKVVILRLFNVYGPGQNPAYAGVISRFIERAVEGKPLIIYGDGLQTRDFVHVGDVAEAFYKAIVGNVTGVFNIASGKPVRIIDLARMIGEIVGGKVKIRYAPPRKGDIRHSYASIEKAKKELKWEPKKELKVELKKMIMEKKSVRHM